MSYDCADSFHTKELCSRLSSSKVSANGKRPFCVFEPLCWGLRATCNVNLRLTGKRVVDFLLVLIELFLLYVTAEELRAKINRKSAFQKQGKGKGKRGFV